VTRVCSGAVLECTLSCLECAYILLTQHSYHTHVTDILGFVLNVFCFRQAIDVPSAADTNATSYNLVCHNNVLLLYVCPKHKQHILHVSTTKSFIFYETHQKFVRVALQKRHQKPRANQWQMAKAVSNHCNLS